MKKTLLLSICAVSIAMMPCAQAIDLKSSALSSVKSVAKTAVSDSNKTDKDAQQEKYKKEYQENIKKQQEKLNTVNAYDKQARLELAKVILSQEEYDEIIGLGSEEQDKALNDAIVKTLSSETFLTDYADYDDAQKAAYIAAATKIQIADNRYKNVSNELTAPLKQIVDGNVSIISTKDELKNAGAMILGIKKNLGTNSDIKKAMKKVNKANDIVLDIPDSERVVYPKEGTIGSINYQLDEINNTVATASKTLSKTLLNKEQRDSLSAIQNNKDLSDEEKNVELNKVYKEYIVKNNEDGTIKENYNKLSDSEKEEYQKASSDIIGAVASYTGLALACTKLGFNISKNPLLAAPLAFELGALKDTGSLVKESSSNLAKTVSQLKKVNKSCGITIAEAAKTTTSTNEKTSSLNKLKLTK